MRAPNADHLVEVLAKANFDAYSKDAGGVTYDGKPIPLWDELTIPVREH